LVERGGRGGFVERGGPRVESGSAWRGTGIDGKAARRGDHRHAGRHHFRRGKVFGFGGDDYYAFATPYEDCWQLRFWRGSYRRVWVCD
jgi:hypothetical protein